MKINGKRHTLHTHTREMNRLLLFNLTLRYLKWIMCFNAFNAYVVCLRFWHHIPIFNNNDVNDFVVFSSLFFSFWIHFITMYHRRRFFCLLSSSSFLISHVCYTNALITRTRFQWFRRFTFFLSLSSFYNFLLMRIFRAWF